MFIDYKKIYKKSKDKIEGNNLSEQGFNPAERSKIVQFLEIPSRMRT